MMKIYTFLWLFLVLPLSVFSQNKEERGDNTDYWERALEKLKISSYGEAVVALDKLLEQKKDNALAYQKRAFAKRKMGNMEGAEADYTRAIGYNSSLAAAYLGRAQVRVKLGNYEQAIEDYNQTIQQQPSHPKMKDILYNRGLAYLKGRKFKEAMNDFREVLKIENENASAWACLGFIYYFTGEIRKACSNWLRARDFGSESAKKNTQRACQCCM